MIEISDPKPVSLAWSLVCMAASLVVAVSFNETILPDKGKVVFLGFFVTTFVGKSIVGMASRNTITIFVSAVALVHIALILVAPRDSLYSGGILFPIGIIDIGVCYLAFRWMQKALDVSR
ncbi:hypothetical protein [Sphingobium sp. RAC03]|uniref:hypothetical protein n=1 Tax=Sphingobium sp. RAC03 TaxID=1843368 RepID=UPI0012374A16|nr:hypothetical protein [Sphingobium sp. RAC03]